MDDNRSNEWIFEMARLSVKKVSAKALNYVMTRFGRPVESDACSPQTIWKELIVPQYPGFGS